MITWANSWIVIDSPYKWISLIFMAIPMMAILVKNGKNHMKGEFVKSENSPYLSFLWFSLKNDHLGLKMKILKFLGIEPNHLFLHKPVFRPPKISLNDFDFSISVLFISESTIFAEFPIIPLWKWRLLWIAYIHNFIMVRVSLNPDHLILISMSNSDK